MKSVLKCYQKALDRHSKSQNATIFTIKWPPSRLFKFVHDLKCMRTQIRPRLYVSPERRGITTLSNKNPQQYSPSQESKKAGRWRGRRTPKPLISFPSYHLYGFEVTVITINSINLLFLSSSRRFKRGVTT